MATASAAKFSSLVYDIMGPKVELPIPETFKILEEGLKSGKMKTFEKPMNLGDDWERILRSEILDLKSLWGKWGLSCVVNAYYVLYLESSTIANKCILYLQIQGDRILGGVGVSFQGVTTDDDETVWTYFKAEDSLDLRA